MISASGLTHDAERCHRARVALTSKVIPSTLHKQHFSTENSLQLLQSSEVGRDILSDSRMRTSTRFDRSNTIFGQSFISDQKLLILSSEDVVGHSGWKSECFSQGKVGRRRSNVGWVARTDVVVISESSTQGQKQSSLSRPYWASTLSF